MSENKENKKEEVIAPEFPSVKFIVDENDLVEVSITVAALKDEKGEYRPKPLRRDLLTQQVDFLSKRVSRIEEELQAINDQDPNQERKKIELTGELLALNNIVLDINKLLKAPYKNYIARFKRLTWRDLSTISSESYVTGANGSPQWSEERNKDAKIRYLLKWWDLTEADRQGRGVPINISRAYQVDGAIISAFLDAYDSAISLTEEDAKN